MSDSKALDINEISTHIWPKNAVRNKEGILEVAGLDVIELEQKFETPLFILDEDDAIQRAKKYVKSFSQEIHKNLTKPTKIYYASKAFSAVGFLKLLLNEGLGVDVATEGELRVALKAGFDPADIIFHGNNKAFSELEFALDENVGLFVVDSYLEIARLAQIAKSKNKTANVLVRVTAGIEAHTHEFVATAHEDQKFGFSLAAGDADEAVRRVIKEDNLNFIGLHSHIGSQIFDNKGFEIAAQRLAQLAGRINQDHNVEIQMLNLGGGMGIAYINSDKPLEIEVMAKELIEIVSSNFSSNGLKMPQLAFEPGRAIVGPSMITLYKVGTIKEIELENGEKRTYVAVDGGMSDNIRPALYGAKYSVFLANRVSTAKPVKSRLVGKHCESGDILIFDLNLPEDVQSGDLLAMPATGAYGRSMASNYNHIPRPAVVSVENGSAKLILRRENEQDLLNLDVDQAPRQLS